MWYMLLDIFLCPYSHLIKNAAIKLIEIFVCCLLIQFAVTDFQTLILPGIPGIDPAWSQCTILSNAVGPDLLMLFYKTVASVCVREAFAFLPHTLDQLKLHRYQA